MKYWTLNPTKSIGDIIFGMSRDEVRKVFANNPTEFQKTDSCENTADDFGYCHVFYDKDNRCDAVEIFDSESINVTFNDIIIFPGTCDNLKAVFKDITEKEAGYLISVSSSIGAYAPDNEIESILFGKSEYYKKGENLNLKLKIEKLLENKNNILKFITAKSYNRYEIIDENNASVVINENEEIVVPLDLIYSFINVAAPYNDVLAECVNIFMDNNNIILDESINLNNPNIFGALLISNENNDLFKEWYQFKNELLNEDCMYINLNDRINILAQYLSLDESFDINQILQLESLEKYDYESNIGSFNELYSLLEAVFSLWNDGERKFDTAAEAQKAAEKYAISKIPFWRRIGLVGPDTTFVSSSTLNKNNPDKTKKDKNSNNKNVKFNEKSYYSFDIKSKNGKVLDRRNSFLIEKGSDGKYTVKGLTNSKEHPNNKYIESATGWDVTKDVARNIGSKLKSGYDTSAKIIGKTTKGSLGLLKGSYNIGKKGYNALTSDTSKRFFKNSAAAMGKVGKAGKETLKSLGKTAYNFVTDKDVQNTAKNIGKAILKPNIEATKALGRGTKRFGRFIGNAAQDIAKGLNSRPLSV